MKDLGRLLTVGNSTVKDNFDELGEVRQKHMV